LNKSELLECNIIDKGAFRGGTIEDLIENFKTSEFCFCPRGTGNFSIRFYETLYYGRIPVVIDTDILLPFSNEIEWNKYIVISNKIEELPEKIYNFWLNNDIEFIQNECRRIYEEYFTLKNISNHMYKEIKSIYECMYECMTSISYRNYNSQWLNIGNYLKNKNYLNINDIVFGGKFISNKVIYHGKYITIDDNLELDYFIKSRNYTIDIMTNIKYDLILVLGSGYGRNIFYYLYNYKYLFSGIDIISGEITKNGIEIQEYIKNKYFKEEKIKILKFDYNNSTEFFKNIENKYKNILVLTFSSIQEITYINDIFFENLLNLHCEKLKCINIEPIGWQITSNSLMKENTNGYRSYYNKNLFQKIKELEKNNKILINNVIVDFFNYDIVESCCSLVEWEKIILKDIQ
jgi:SAM-dependent methyltransferase